MKKIVNVVEYIDKKEYKIIRKEMKKRNITDTDIANELFITRSYINAMLNARKPLQYFFRDYLEENNFIKFED